ATNWSVTEPLGGDLAEFLGREGGLRAKLALCTKTRPFITIFYRKLNNISRVEKYRYFGGNLIQTGAADRYNAIIAVIGIAPTRPYCSYLCTGYFMGTHLYL